jgi:hypothetical protein
MTEQKAALGFEAMRRALRAAHDAEVRIDRNPTAGAHTSPRRERIPKMNKHDHHLLLRATLALLAISLVFAVGYADRAEGANNHGKPDREDAVEPFARDVFVVVDGRLENPTAGTSPDAQLFNLAGTPLDVTWGRWTSASATSSAHTARNPNTPHTDVRIQLSGLVPGGVYSLFYATFGPDSRHPLCPGQERTLPLTARNRNQAPDPSSFVADADGEAEFRARVDGSLLEATHVLYSVIYHFDGMTYHPLPNRGEHVTQGDDCRTSFGVDAMRQLTVWQKL